MRIFSGMRRLGLALAAFFGPLLHGERAEKPNVILIMADDVSWEAFGCYGAEDYETPHLDRLAGEGVRFEHCYSTPICTPSRVMLMTGQYNFRNYTHFGYLNPQEKTFGHLMREAGYRTAIAGKWQLNGLYNQLPGHQDNHRPHEAGFDEYMLWQVTTGKERKDGGGERFWSPPFEHNGRFVTVGQNQGKYGPDLLCDFVCDFMERQQDEPFFVYYPMVLVHDPFVPTPDTIGDASRGQETNKQPKDPAQRKANFVAMVNYMDKIVGRIVTKVESLGLAENTIVLFTADNGTNTSITSRWNGRDIRGGKGGMKDMGTHVPLIAYWKNHTPVGLVLDDLVDFTDFYPTLARAAGRDLAAGDPIDGRSFFPQLSGEPGRPREWVLCHYQSYWDKEPGQFARTQTHKLYREGSFFQVPGDLEETHDIPVGSADKAAETTRDALAAVLADAPPYPKGRRTRTETDRPTHPDWPDLHGVRFDREDGSPDLHQQR